MQFLIKKACKTRLNCKFLLHTQWKTKIPDQVGDDDRKTKIPNQAGDDDRKTKIPDQVGDDDREN